MPLSRRTSSMGDGRADIPTRPSDAEIRAPMWQSMVAGAAGGVCETLVGFPFDTLKVGGGRSVVGGRWVGSWRGRRHLSAGRALGRHRPTPLTTPPPRLAGPGSKRGTDWHVQRAVQRRGLAIMRRGPRLVCAVCRLHHRYYGSCTPPTTTTNHQPPPQPPPPPTTKGKRLDYPDWVPSWARSFTAGCFAGVVG